MLWMFLGEMLILIVFLIRLSKRYEELLKPNRQVFQLSWMAPFSLFLLEKAQVLERYPQMTASIHYKISVLYGKKQAAPLTRLFTAQMVSVSVLLFVFAGAAGAVAGNDPFFLLYGLVIVAFLPFLSVKSLDRRLNDKKRQIVLMLPEFLNKLVLLVNAGETVSQAVARCSEGISKENHPLKKELHVLAVQLANHYPFPKALEEFNVRCSVQEITMFTTTVLLNYRRGGEDFVLSMRGISRDLWEKRKAMARTLGEEASSKLVFPMVLIFFVVLVVVAAPAVLLMNN